MENFTHHGALLSTLHIVYSAQECYTVNLYRYLTCPLFNSTHLVFRDHTSLFGGFLTWRGSLHALDDIVCTCTVHTVPVDIGDDIYMYTSESFNVVC